MAQSTTMCGAGGSRLLAPACRELVLHTVHVPSHMQNRKQQCRQVDKPIQIHKRFPSFHRSFGNGRYSVVIVPVSVSPHQKNAASGVAGASGNGSKKCPHNAWANIWVEILKRFLRMGGKTWPQIDVHEYSFGILFHRIYLDNNQNLGQAKTKHAMIVAPFTMANMLGQQNVCAK